jgi:predicted nucleic acid-binding protein
MMTRIFFDANVIIEWLNKDSAENSTCLKCIENSILTGGTLLISPTTLAIVFYFVSKKVRNKKLLLKKLEESMKLFEFTTEDSKTVEQSFNSAFLDLEDALQYFSAMGSKADAILTYNVHDFTHTKIPVYHPLTYLSYFN